jgi:hypothetical protein
MTTETDIYTSISMDEPSEVYEDPEPPNTVPREKRLPLPSTISTPKSNLQFSSKVYIAN